MNGPVLYRHPDTHYWRTRSPGDSRPSADGTISADIAIVGGGLAGLTLARELAATGKAPVLIEAEGVAFGASGRNGGFVSPGYACGQEAIARRVGPKAADELFRMSLDAVDYVRARGESYGEAARIEIRNGVMSVRRQPGGRELRAMQTWLAQFGYEAEFLGRDQVRALAKSATYHEALRSERSFHIHPLNYARALAREAEVLGAAIYEGTPAQQLARVEEGYLITTPKARIKAGQVVLATGGYTGRLLPALQHAYVPLRPI